MSRIWRSELETSNADPPQSCENGNGIFQHRRLAGNSHPEKKYQEIIGERERESPACLQGRRAAKLPCKKKFPLPLGNGNGNRIYKIAGSTACVIR